MLNWNFVLGGILFIILAIGLASVMNPPEMPAEVASTCARGIPDDLTLEGEGFSFTLKGVGTELNQQLEENGITISKKCEQ